MAISSSAPLRSQNSATSASLLMPKRVVMILGMSRSGGRCLAGCLQGYGLSLGHLASWGMDRSRERLENGEIIALHESILTTNGRSWDKPGKHLKWNSYQQQVARSILESHANFEVWGFKDPRTLFTLDGWLQLGISAEFVGIIRNPIEVASSIMREGNGYFGQRQILKVWYRYNARLLALYKRKPFPILSFDWDGATFEYAVNKLTQQMDLVPVRATKSFYEPNLIRTRSNKYGMPAHVRRLYERLYKISLRYQ